jgi:hypothetical protein
MIHGATADAIAARRALRDCYVALKELEQAVTTTELRLRWVTAVTLLRVVGHVLKKVDGERSTYLSSAINTVWNIVMNEKGNEIFLDFIERERNTILKEYDTAERHVHVIYKTDEQLLGILVGARIMKPVDAVRNAISWWEKLLRDVEDQAQFLRISDHKQ